MKKFKVVVLIFIFNVCAGFYHSASAQASATPQTRSQEFSESDGIPVLTKHLPEYESAVNRAVYILNPEQLRQAVGDRSVIEAIDFTGGTEAVTAPYDAGMVLLVEYTTPQFAVEADSQIRKRLSEAPEPSPAIYRKIGNYAAFVFDVRDEASAGALLDQIKYEKEIRWLGEDPFALQRAERNFVLQASDLFFNTMLTIVGGLGISVVIGIFAGFIFFYFRVHQRSKFETFSDAGGMTRLNLDGFTPDILPKGLLDK